MGEIDESQSNFGTALNEILLSEKRVLAPVLANWPNNWAVVGEVALRRAERGLQTEILVLSRQLEHPYQSGRWRTKLDVLARIFGKDAEGQLRKLILRGGASRAVRLVHDVTITKALTIALDTDLRETMKTQIFSELSGLHKTSFVRSHLDPRRLTEMELEWANVYGAVQSWLATHSPQEPLLIYNGRGIRSGAALAAGRSSGHSVVCFDTMPTQRRPLPVIFVRDNFYSPRQRAEEVERFWDSGFPGLREELAAQWFKSRRIRLAGRNQAVAAILPTKTQASEYVSFFSSSPDEYSYLGVEGGRSLMGQLQLVFSFLAHARKTPDTNFIMRLHPNMKNKNRTDRELWAMLEETIPNNMVLISPEMSIDSYGILERSKIVITYGSTIAAEAAFMGVPVFDGSDSVFTHLGVAQRISCLDGDLQRIEYLADLQRAHEQSLKYGYWKQEGGWRPEGLSAGSGWDPVEVRNVPLEPFGRSFRRLRDIMFFTAKKKQVLENRTRRYW